MSRRVRLAVFVGALVMLVQICMPLAAGAATKGTIVDAQKQLVYGGRVTFSPDDLNSPPIVCQVGVHGEFLADGLRTDVTYTVVYNPGGSNQEIRATESFKSIPGAEIHCTVTAEGFVIQQVGHGNLTPSVNPDRAPHAISMGAYVGGATFVASGDYSTNVQAGGSARVDFRYELNRRFRLTVGAGYTRFTYTGTLGGVDRTGRSFKWSGMNAKLIPIPVQAQYLLPIGAWVHHVGVGTGLYYVRVEDSDGILQDVDFKLHRYYYWGLTGELGTERRLSPSSNTSIAATSAVNWVFSQHNAGFTRGFNGVAVDVDVHVGLVRRFGNTRKT